MSSSAFLFDKTILAMLKKGLVSLILLLSFSSLAHEDHSSRHGGLVIMYSDLHFEIVAPDSGGVQVYFSDDIRRAQPAAVVSDVAVEIEGNGDGIESVFMRISDTGDYWEGDSSPITNEDALIRLAFISQQSPFVLEIPAAALPQFMPPMPMPMEEEPAMESTQDMHSGHMQAESADPCQADCSG